jgi:hypothetical protein
MLFNTGISALSSGIDTVVDIGREDSTPREGIREEVESVVEDACNRSEEGGSSNGIRNAIDNATQSAIERRTRYNHRLIERVGSTLELRDDGFYILQDRDEGQSIHIYEALETLHDQMAAESIKDLDGELRGERRGAERAQTRGLERIDEIGENAQTWIDAYGAGAEQLDIQKSACDLIFERENQTQLQTALDIASFLTLGRAELFGFFPRYAASFTGEEAILDLKRNHATTVTRIVLGDPDAELKEEGGWIDD